MNRFALKYPISMSTPGCRGCDLAIEPPHLHVLTLLRDPAGVGLELFLRCARSVQAQRGVRIHWHVSATRVAAAYEFHLAGLAGATVVRRSPEFSLAEHLHAALADLPSVAAVHLLCHDDWYTYSDSAAHIANALRTESLLLIEPAAGRPDGQDQTEFEQSDRAPAPARLGRRERLQAAAGVNRFGGLSTLAWQQGPEPVPSVLAYEMYADLALRRELSKVRVPVVLAGRLVSETRWFGQYQHELGDWSRTEHHNWVAQCRTGTPSRIAYAWEATLHGDADLALAWRESACSWGRCLMPAWAVRSAAWVHDIRRRLARLPNRRGWARVGSRLMRRTR